MGHDVMTTIEALFSAYDAHSTLLTYHCLHSLVKSIHYCACKKPWTCPVAREKQKERHRIDVLSGLVNLTTCNLLHREWFKLRRSYEDRMVLETGDNKIYQGRRGTFQEDIFMQYCEGEGQYIPIIYPEAITKGI